MQEVTQTNPLVEMPIVQTVTARIPRHRGVRFRVWDTEHDAVGTAPPTYASQLPWLHIIATTGWTLPPATVVNQLLI